MTAAVVLGYLFTVAVLIDAARRPAFAWAAADRDRTYWIGGLVVGLLLIPVGVGFAICYLAGVLPRLSHSDYGPANFRKPQWIRWFLVSVGGRWSGGPIG